MAILWTAALVLMVPPALSQEQQRKPTHGRVGSAVFAEAKEVLPWWAYLNRTMYPDVKTYDVAAERRALLGAVGGQAGSFERALAGSQQRSDAAATLLNELAQEERRDDTHRPDATAGDMGPPATAALGASERRRTFYPQFSVGLLSDVQYADQEESNRRHFRLSDMKLQHAVAEMNANRTHLDCVFHLGDLVDHDMPRYGPVMVAILDKLKYPVYHVLGNHGFEGTSAGADAASDAAAQEAIPRILGMPGRYYSLLAGPRHAPYRLVILDGNDVSLYATPRGSDKRREAEGMLKALKRARRKNANKFNGALGSTQIDWMKRQLGEACRLGQRVVIFLHHPVKPDNEPTNLWNDLVVVPIITSFHCVAAVINGHAHKFLYDFHYTMFRTVHFITYGGMVQSPFTSYGFADFYPTSLHLHGLIFGRQIEYKLDLAYKHPAAATVPVATIAEGHTPALATAASKAAASPGAATAQPQQEPPPLPEGAQQRSSNSSASTSTGGRWAPVTDTGVVERVPSRYDAVILAGGLADDGSKAPIAFSNSAQRDLKPTRVPRKDDVDAEDLPIRVGDATTAAEDRLDDDFIFLPGVSSSNLFVVVLLMPLVLVIAVVGGRRLHVWRRTQPPSAAV
jgi:hypothetical protein